MSGLVEPVDGDDAEFTRLARLGRLRVTYACECCRRRFPVLERDGCCPACHRRLIAAGGVPGAVRILPKGAPAPVSVRGMSEYCGNGHKWRPETTRWRYRDRGGRHRNRHQPTTGGGTMNLQDIITRALADGAQVTISITPKTWTEDTQEETES